MKTTLLLGPASRRAFAAAIMILLVIPVFSLAQTMKTTARSDADSGLRKFIGDYYEAWNTLDPENADKYYDKDSTLVFYDIAPLKYKNWNEYKQSVKALFTQYSSFKLIPGNDLKVRRNGEMALITLTFHISAVHKMSGPLELDVRHTAVLEKRQGKWIIVHEHISAPLPI